MPEPHRRMQYPQRLHGLIDRVPKQFASVKRPVLLPPPGVVRLLDTVPGIAAARVLIVGVTPLREYDYREIHDFAKRAITYLASVPAVHHLALPVYGPPEYRLDAVKSFESEVDGVVDAFGASGLPPSSKR